MWLEKWWKSHVTAGLLTRYPQVIHNPGREMVETALELVVLVVAGGSAAFIGAALGAVVGRGAAIDAHIAPLRGAVADLLDRYEHATRRWAKRERDAARGSGDDRQLKLDALSRRILERRRGGHGVPSEARQGPDETA